MNWLWVFFRISSRRPRDIRRRVLDARLFQNIAIFRTSPSARPGNTAETPSASKMKRAISARMEMPAAQGYRHQRINWDIEQGALWQRRGIACRMDLLGTLSEDGSASAAPGEPAASGVRRIGKPEWLLCGYATNCLSGLDPLWEHAPIGRDYPDWTIGNWASVAMEALWQCLCGGRTCGKRNEMSLVVMPCGSEDLWQETL